MNNKVDTRKKRFC